MEIKWQAKAVKQLKKIGDRGVQERIFSASRALSTFPDCPNVKPLVDHDCTHRLRVGNYRILFNAFLEVNIISIEEVKKRNERTY